MSAEWRSPWNILFCCTMVLWLIIFFVLLGPCLMLISSLQNGNRNRLRISVSRAKISKANHGQLMKKYGSTSALNAQGIECRMKKFASTSALDAVEKKDVWRMFCTDFSTFYDILQLRRFYKRSFRAAATLCNITRMYKTEFVLSPVWNLGVALI